VAEQRYLAVLAVIADGLTIKQVAEKVGVSRQTLHAWLARYEMGAFSPERSLVSSSRSTTWRCGLSQQECR
jgi:transposase